MVHDTRNAHALHGVSEVLRKMFSAIDDLVAHIRKPRSGKKSRPFRPRGTLIVLRGISSLVFSFVKLLFIQAGSTLGVQQGSGATRIDFEILFLPDLVVSLNLGPFIVIGTHKKNDTGKETAANCSSEPVEAFVTVEENESSEKKVKFVSFSLEVSHRCLYMI